MKKISLLFVILSLFLHVQAQQLDFFQLYSAFPEFQASDVKQTSDGGYLLAGGYHAVNGGDFILMKTDSLGNEKWIYSNNRFDGMDGSNVVYSLAVSEPYYYLAGYIDTFYYNQIYVVKMDTARNKIWEVIDTALGGISSISKIRFDQDHNLLLTGLLSNAIIDSAKIYTAKIDTGGHFIWKHYFTNHIGAFGYDIIGINSNQFIVSGNYITYSGGFIDTTTSIIFSFDSTGNINWNNEFPDTVSNGFTSLLISHDSSIYCGQYYSPQYSNPNNPNSAIVKFDSSGNFTYRKDFLNSNGRHVGIFEKQDNSFITTFGFLNVLFLDYQGDSVSSYRNNNFFPLCSSIIDQQGKVILVGNYQSQAGHPYISYLMRVSDTTLTGVSDPLFVKDDIFLYPNPSDGHHLSILFTKQTSAEKAIHVMDVNGKIVYSLNSLPDGIANLDLSNLNNGIYLLQFIFSNHQNFIYKKIVILK